MTDEPFEQLHLAHLPSYTRGHLWLTTPDGQAVQINRDGSFVLPERDQLELRWAHPEGSALTTWPNLTGENRYQLEWDGIVRLGGFIDRTHILEDLQGIPLMVVELTGGAYPADYRRWPTLNTLREGAYSRDDVDEIDPSDSGHWYSLLLSLDSPLVDFVHHALVNGSTVDCYATFGEENARWQDLIGLPLLLDSITLLSTHF